MIGVAAMFFITGTNLSIMATMGIIMMVGLVVAYSIMLVDYANGKVAQGDAPKVAVQEAAGVRIRPILMMRLRR